MNSFSKVPLCSLFQLNRVSQVVNISPFIIFQVQVTLFHWENVTAQASTPLFATATVANRTEAFSFTIRSTRLNGTAHLLTYSSENLDQKPVNGPAARVAPVKPVHSLFRFYVLVSGCRRRARGRGRGLRRLKPHGPMLL